MAKARGILGGARKDLSSCNLSEGREIFGGIYDVDSSDDLFHSGGSIPADPHGKASRRAGNSDKQPRKGRGKILRQGVIAGLP